MTSLLTSSCSSSPDLKEKISILSIKNTTENIKSNQNRMLLIAIVLDGVVLAFGFIFYRLRNALEGKVQIKTTKFDKPF